MAEFRWVLDFGPSIAKSRCRIFARPRVGGGAEEEESSLSSQFMVNIKRTKLAIRSSVCLY